MVNSHSSQPLEVHQVSASCFSVDHPPDAVLQDGKCYFITTGMAPHFMELQFDGTAALHTLDIIGVGLEEVNVWGTHADGQSSNLATHHVCPDEIGFSIQRLRIDIPSESRRVQQNGFASVKLNLIGCDSDFIAVFNVITHGLWINRDRTRPECAALTKNSFHSRAGSINSQVPPANSQSPKRMPLQHTSANRDSRGGLVPPLAGLPSLPRASLSSPSATPFGSQVPGLLLGSFSSGNKENTENADHIDQDVGATRNQDHSSSRDVTEPQQMLTARLNTARDNLERRWKNKKNKGKSKDTNTSSPNQEDENEIQRGVSVVKTKHIQRQGVVMF
jgi:hypothetical protein